MDLVFYVDIGFWSKSSTAFVAVQLKYIQQCLFNTEPVFSGTEPENSVTAVANNNKTPGLSGVLQIM